MSATWSAFVSAVWLGLFVAAPIGPVGLLCITRSLNGGMACGLLTGLGAASVHAGWAFATALGHRSAISVLGPLGSGGTVHAVAAAVLFILGARALAAGRRASHATTAPVPDALLANFGAGAALALANPLTVILFAAAIPSLAPSQLNAADSAAFALGAFAGSAGWWLVLSGGVASFRTQLSGRWIARSNRLAGVALILFSGLVLKQAFDGFGAERVG